MSRSSQAQRLSKALLDLAKKDNSRTINELRVIVGMERAVARLQGDDLLSRHLIFKGGFVLLKGFGSPRFTRDIDALAKGLKKKDFEKSVIQALDTDIDDGLWYGDTTFSELNLLNGYGGIRVSFAFQIGDPPNEESRVRKLSRLHLDISFEDMPRPPQQQKMESILNDFDPVSWRTYPIESIIAEKLETVFRRGSANSRAKDIFDLNLLLPQVKRHAPLQDAVQTTFQRRGTPIPKSFAEEAQTLDLRVLKSAWPSVEIDTTNDTFEDHWKSFLSNLTTLDLKVI